MTIMKLIDKDKVVAEIEKQIEFGKFKCQQSQENNDRESYVAWSEHIATCGKIFSFINTLEVKEVDLEKEIQSWIEDTSVDGYGYYRDDVYETAEHFYELGLKAKKGE